MRTKRQDLQVLYQQKLIFYNAVDDFNIKLITGFVLITKVFYTSQSDNIRSKPITFTVFTSTRTIKRGSKTKNVYRISAC